MAEYHGQIQLALAGFYDVLTAEGTLFRTRARGNFRKKDLKPLVGDWVTFSAQTPVANVDQVIVVTAVKMPDWSSNLLDRQLVALEEKNIEPVIYFTKTDLLTKAEMASFADIVAGYREIGYQVVWPDEAFDQTSLKTVKKLLADKLTVLMGQTGAGKSTLLNHLSPELNLATGEVSQALSRGKHTTRQVSLIELYGGLVADTPGFSAFEVFDMPARELGQYFRELNDYARNCRFRGCVHLNEPNCAVKEAVSQGKIMASRYDNYKLFYDLIAGRRPVYNKHDKKH
jgi:ribosome biogenesis GTPase